jgi:hypothetical protein
MPPSRESPLAPPASVSSPLPPAACCSCRRSVSRRGWSGEALDLAQDVAGIAALIAHPPARVDGAAAETGSPIHAVAAGRPSRAGAAKQAIAALAASQRVIAGAMIR